MIKSLKRWSTHSLVGTYLFQVNNRNTRKRSEICSKLTVTTPEWRQQSGVFSDNFEHISHLFLVFLLLTFSIYLFAGMKGLLAKQFSSPSDVFLGKRILKIYNKFTGEHPCWSAISIKLLCNFIEIDFGMGVLF